MVNAEAAEKSVREAIRLDASQRLPQALHLLGVMLAERQDYAGAAGCFRGYLRYATDAALAAGMRKQLAAIEDRE